MGDREIKQFNRILFAKFGNRTQELHLQRLRHEIKPVIDNQPPPTFTHLTDRQKKKQRWSDEQARIEYENMLLLQRMRSIMTETQNKQFLDVGQAGSNQGGSSSILLGGPESAVMTKGSLNRGERLKEMRRILHENEQLLARIQARGPTYNVQEWEQQHIQKEKILSGMGRFPYKSTTLPPSVMADLQKAKAIKRYGTMRHPVGKPSTDHSGPGNYHHSTSASRLEDFPTSASSYEQSELDSTSQPITPQGRGASTTTTPRRVHHLPPKAATEEKSNSSRKQKTGSASRSGARKRAAAAQLQAIEMSIQLENIDGLLATPSTSGDDSAAQSSSSPALPRVFVYLRQDNGEYTPHAEVHLQALELVNGKSYRGVATVPGLEPPTLSGEQIDRRVRIAIFAADPNDNSGLPPKDNTTLIGEARFSLQHFLGFQKLNYKLKVLRHGLPISGANFGKNGSLTSTDMPDEEIERRRALPETILVLQYTNKAQNEAELAARSSEDATAAGTTTPSSTKSKDLTKELAQASSPQSNGTTSTAATNSSSSHGHLSLQLKFAAKNIATGVTTLRKDTPYLHPVVYIFATDAATNTESLIGQTERLEVDPTSTFKEVILFSKSIHIGQFAAEPHQSLRMALYDTIETPATTSSPATKKTKPVLTRTTLLGDIRLTIGEILAHQQESSSEADVWFIPLRARPGDAPRDAFDIHATPTFAIRVETPPHHASTEQQWQEMVQRQLKVMKKKQEALAAAASTTPTKPDSSSSHSKEDTRRQKLSEFLESEKGRRLFPESYQPPAELVQDLLAAVPEGGEAFLYTYFDAALEANTQYHSSELLVAGVSSGYETQSSSRATIFTTLNSRSSHLLPHPPDGSLTITEAEVDQLATEAALPLGPLAPSCAANRDELLRRLEALETSGATFKKVSQLAQAVKRNGRPETADAASRPTTATTRSRPTTASRNRASKPTSATKRAPSVEKTTPAAIVEPTPPTPAPKTAAEILADIQATRAAQEAEVARVMKEQGLTQPATEDDYADEEFSKPYIEPEPSPEQVKAATKIQALQRGRATRSKKSAILAEKRAAKEAAAREKARLKAEQELEARDDAAAALKLAEGKEIARAKAEAELEATKKKVEEEKAILAKLKQEEEKAAAAAAKIKAEQQAKENAKAEADAKAAKALADVEAKIKEMEAKNQDKTYTVTLSVGCQNLPLVNHQSPSPMVALYANDLTSGQFTFVHQTERIQSSTNPTFVEPLSLAGVHRRGVDRQLMFSIYNAENEEIKEEDVTGCALFTSHELIRQISRVQAGQPFSPIQLQVAQGVNALENTFLTINSLTFDETETVSEYVIPDGEMGIWISIRDIILPSHMKECNSLAALYTKDHESTNFNFKDQTEQVIGTTSPNFTKPICITKPESGHDTDCMLNIYNHLSGAAELSADESLGACLFSLNKLLASPKGRISVALVQSGHIVGQVILKTSPGASSQASRPSTAHATAAATGAAGAGGRVYDLTVSCSNLPRVPGRTGVCEPMVALYGQDVSSGSFSFVGQTEKESQTNNPHFDSKIRIDDQTGSGGATSTGGGGGDRPLMFIVYDVADENAITEQDKIGNCALTWNFLKDQSSTSTQRVTLPLLNEDGAQIAATITIQIQTV